MVKDTQIPDAKSDEREIVLNDLKGVLDLVDMLQDFVNNTRESVKDGSRIPVGGDFAKEANKRAARIMLRVYDLYIEPTDEVVVILNKLCGKQRATV
jgi:hypothetical protein